MNLDDFVKYFKENALTILGYLIIIPIVSGTILINQDISKYGLVDYSVFKTHALYVGLWFLFLVSFFSIFYISLFCKFIKALKNKENKISSESASDFLFFDLLLLPPVYFFDFFFFLSFLSNKIYSVNNSNNLGFTFFIFLCLFSFFSISWFLINNELFYFYDKENRKFRISIYVLVVVFTCIFPRCDILDISFSYPLPDYLQKVIWVCSIFVGLSGSLYILKKHIVAIFNQNKLFFSCFFIFLIFCMILCYSKFFYPYLPEEFGGGFRQQVTIKTDENYINGYIIHKDSDFTYFLPSDDRDNIIIFENNQINEYKIQLQEYSLFNKKYKIFNLREKTKAFFMNQKEKTVETKKKVEVQKEIQLQNAN